MIGLPSHEGSNSIVPHSHPIRCETFFQMSESLRLHVICVWIIPFVASGISKGNYRIGPTRRAWSDITCILVATDQNQPLPPTELSFVEAVYPIEPTHTTHLLNHICFRKWLA